jgi:hypothetical protein
MAKFSYVQRSRRGRAPKHQAVPAGTVEVPLGCQRLARVTRLDDLVLIGTSTRLAGTSAAARTGGVVVLPVSRIGDVLKAVRKVAKA